MGSFIQAGMSIMGELGKARIAGAQADAQQMIGDANTYAQNLQGQSAVAAANTNRLIANAANATNAAIQNKSRSMGNQLRLTAAGNRSNDFQVNMARTVDKMTQGTVESRIAAAEQMGALVASRAGTGGSSAAALSALNIAQSRAKAYMDENNDLKTYDMKMQAAGLATNMYLSLDLNQSMAQIDLARDTFTPMPAPVVPRPPNFGQVALGAFTGGAFGLGEQPGIAMAENNARGSGGFNFQMPAGWGGTRGTVGNTPGYASQSLLGGVNSFSSSWGAGSGGDSFGGGGGSWGVGGNSYGFSTGDSGSSYGVGGNSFNFSFGGGE